MSGSYMERAVEAMAAFLAAQLPGELSTLETEQSLAANTVPRPVAYLRHRADWDNRSPLICVFDDGATFADGRQFVCATRVPVVVSYEGDARIDVGELAMRRLVTGILDAVRRDPTLGGEVIQAIPIEVSSARLEGDRSTTRYVWAIVYEVHTYRRIET